MTQQKDLVYENFDIFIESTGAEGQYGLKARAVGSETDQITYQTFPFEEDQYEELAYYLRDVVIATPEHAEKMGALLREFLFPAPVKSLFDQTLLRAEAQGKDGVRIRLNIHRQSEELYQIPWEYCRGERTFLALNDDTPLVRYMPTNRPASSIAVPEKVKILIAWANPSDLATLDVAKEAELVQQSLAKLVDSGRVEIEVLAKATPRDLARKVRRWQPHILHFIGHGVLKENGEGALALEDRDGRHTLVDAENMLVLLQGDDTKLVVLSACETAATGAENKEEQVNSARALMGVGPKLVWGGTPAVVAMQYVLPDSAGVTFMQVMYDWLADGKPLDTAVTEARIELQFESLNNAYWGIPVLFMRVGDGHLFEREGAADRREPAQANNLDAANGDGKAPTAPATLTLPQVSALGKLISENFTPEELRDLTLALGLDYDDLRGSSKSSKARELGDYARRHGKVAELWAQLYQRRNHVDWEAALK